MQQIYEHNCISLIAKYWQMLLIELHVRKIYLYWQFSCELRHHYCVTEQACDLAIEDSSERVMNVIADLLQFLTQTNVIPVDELEKVISSQFLLGTCYVEKR